jgi:transcriptional regulator with XRE-family HTH domain
MKVPKQLRNVSTPGHDSDVLQSVKPPRLGASFGQRLRAERERIGLTQAELGEVGGVARSTQHIYESDIRSPDAAYLERITSVGVDVGYLVHGHRMDPTNGHRVRISRAALANIYRAVDELCVDSQGTLMPLDFRVRIFELLCASVSAEGAEDATVAQMRAIISEKSGA